MASRLIRGTRLIHQIQGQPDEHCAMQIGGITTEPPPTETAIFVKSNLTWVPSVVQPQYIFEKLHPINGKVPCKHQLNADEVRFKYI